MDHVLQEKAGVEKQNSKKGSDKNEHACNVDGVSWVSDLRLPVRGLPNSENSKLVKAPTVPKVTSRNPGHSAGAHWHG